MICCVLLPQRECVFPVLKYYRVRMSFWRWATADIPLHDFISALISFVQKPKRACDNVVIILNLPIDWWNKTFQSTEGAPTSWPSSFSRHGMKAFNNNKDNDCHFKHCGSLFNRIWSLSNKLNCRWHPQCFQWGRLDCDICFLCLCQYYVKLTYNASEPVIHCSHSSIILVFIARLPSCLIWNQPFCLFKEQSFHRVRQSGSCE